MGKKIMYEQIYEDLLEKIKSGEFAAGDQLPTENELAGQYGVSRITTKKSMNLLAENHYITRIAGKGSFVNSEEQTKQADILAEWTDDASEWKSIAVIFDTFDSDYGSRMLRSIERECTRRHYHMIFKCTYGSFEMEKTAIYSALAKGVEGILLMCAQGENFNSTVLKLVYHKYPLVLVDRAMNGISIPCVKTDNYAAAKELTGKLIAAGHKNICFLTHSYTSTMSIHERYEGFVSCMMQHKSANGILEKIDNYNPAPENVDLEYQEFDYSQMNDMIERNKECTAFIAAEYRLGLFLSRALKQKGLTKAIATFDGIEAMYENDDFIHVRQNEAEIGRQAVILLEDFINGNPKKEDIYIPYEISSQKSIHTGNENN